MQVQTEEEAGLLHACPMASSTITSDDQSVESTVSRVLRIGVFLRTLMFIMTLLDIVLMATSKQTKVINLPFSTLPLRLDAHFKYSPAQIYFVVAQCVACTYSIVTATVATLSRSRQFSPAAKLKLLLLFGSMDAVMVGMMGSATGAGASVAYIGFRGSSHVGWNKICNVFDNFCRHVASALVISLLAISLLILLLLLSIRSLYRLSSQ